MFEMIWNYHCRMHLDSNSNAEVDVVDACLDLMLSKKKRMWRWDSS